MTTHLDPIFSKLGLLKVADIFQLQFCFLCMIVTMDLHPPILVHILPHFVNMHHCDSHVASCSGLYLQRKNNFNNGIRLIQYSEARLWNTLPSPIRDS